MSGDIDGKQKRKTFSVSLDRELYEEFRKACDGESIRYSQMIERLIKKYLEIPALFSKISPLPTGTSLAGQRQGSALQIHIEGETRNLKIANPRNQQITLSFSD